LYILNIYKKKNKKINKIFVIKIILILFFFFKKKKKKNIKNFLVTELIYSFRDNIESDMPSYLSDNSIRALNKLKEIKEKISIGIIKILFLLIYLFI